MNRKLTGSIATYHFAPTASSESNLKRENINTDHLYVTGNTVIDALDTTVQDNYVFDDAAINALDPENVQFLLLHIDVKTWVSLCATCTKLFAI